MNQITFETQILTPLYTQLTANAARPALYIQDNTYTYFQLSQRIAAIRTYLQENHLGGQPIALLADDHIDTYASIIALWSEGCAYIPLHPLQPPARNLSILQQTQTKYLLCTTPQSPTAQQAFNNEVNIISTPLIETTGTEPAPPQPQPQNQLAYILFTSGSTGTPKGVCLSRQNLAAFINSFKQTGITISPDDRCLQAFDHTFDVSIQTTLTTLMAGACLYTIPYGQIKYLYTASLIIQHRLTNLVMAPSMLTYLQPYFSQLQADCVKTTILTAEASRLHTAQQWFQYAPNTEIYDFYGPTEATIYCTYYKLNRNSDNHTANGLLSIGKPLANVRATIIDEKGHPLPEGQKGELCIAGPQITKGYWNNPEKNKTAFITIPGKQETYYRTGDLCQTLPDGNILYYGRIDQQAKIQGYRVELGEIEYQAATHLNNQYRTIAITYQTLPGLDQIALFIESEPIETAPLIKHLENTLPHYMLPSTIKFIPQLPLNNSQKIDRIALKQQLNQTKTTE